MCFWSGGQVGGKGDTVQRRRPCAGTSGGGRRVVMLSWRECKSWTQLQSGRAAVRREKTGLVTGLLGEGRFALTVLRATTLYVLTAFPWKSACLQPGHAGKYTPGRAEVRMTFLWSFRKSCVRNESFPWAVLWLESVRGHVWRALGAPRGWRGAAVARCRSCSASYASVSSWIKVKLNSCRGLVLRNAELRETVTTRVTRAGVKSGGPCVDFAETEERFCSFTFIPSRPAPHEWSDALPSLSLCLSPCCPLSFCRSAWKSW